MYFNRAKAFYDRGFWDVEEEKDGKPWLDLAAADFEKATEMNPGDYMGFDMLGVMHEDSGEWEKAIRDYRRELALNPLGRERLATAYCDWGFELARKKSYNEAAAVFEKSTEFGTADDKSCRSEPYESLVRIYTSETHQYDKAWDVVRRAPKAGRLIPLGVIEQLRKDSGRAD